jgi:hypothetical protein
MNLLPAIEAYVSVRMSLPPKNGSLAEGKIQARRKKGCRVR